MLKFKFLPPEDSTFLQLKKGRGGYPSIPWGEGEGVDHVGAKKFVFMSKIKVQFLPTDGVVFYWDVILSR